MTKLGTVLKELEGNSGKLKRSNVRKWRMVGETKKLYLAGEIGFNEAWIRTADERINKEIDRH